MAASCSVGPRCSLDLVVLWLWCRLAAAAPVRPPAWDWEGHGAAVLKKKKRKGKERKGRRKEGREKRKSLASGQDECCVKENMTPRKKN